MRQVRAPGKPTATAALHRCIRVLHLGYKMHVLSSVAPLTSAEVCLQARGLGEAWGGEARTGERGAGQETSPVCSWAGFKASSHA